MFTVWDYIYDFLKPSLDEDRYDQGTYYKCCTSYCSLCYHVLDLVRSDSMAYIYLTGNPFCNSARFCGYLCRQSVLIQDSQSSSRAYLICSHLLIAAIIGLYAFKEQKK